MRQALTFRNAPCIGFRLYARISRVLLTLVACLLVVMPWTEYFCNFDKFLRGGQDVELGLLAVLTVLCLVLVLFQTGRTMLATLLSCLHWCATLFRKTVFAKAATQLQHFACFLERASPGITEGFLQPLQI